MTTVNEKRVVLQGRLAELVTARKVKICRKCYGSIFPEDTYWRVTCGSGLGAIKHPEHICVMCFADYAEKHKPEGVK